MAWKIGKFKCKLMNLYNFWCQIKKNHKIKSYCGKFVENNNWKVGNLYMVLDVVGGHQSYFCMTNETRNGILTNVKGKMSLSLFQSTVENCNFRETQFVFMSTKHQIFVITSSHFCSHLCKMILTNNRSGKKIESTIYYFGYFIWFHFICFWDIWSTDCELRTFF